MSLFVLRGNLHKMRLVIYIIHVLWRVHQFSLINMFLIE